MSSHSPPEMKLLLGLVQAQGRHLDQKIHRLRVGCGLQGHLKQEWLHLELDPSSVVDRLPVHQGIDTRQLAVYVQDGLQAVCAHMLDTRKSSDLHPKTYTSQAGCHCECVGHRIDVTSVYKQHTRIRLPMGNEYHLAFHLHLQLGNVG